MMRNLVVLFAVIVFFLTILKVLNIVDGFPGGSASPNLRHLMVDDIVELVVSCDVEMIRVMCWCAKSKN